MMPQIAHIDLDAFFVSVERLRDRGLRGRPVVVGGDPNSRGVVSCASYEARRYGLKAGMSLAAARRLCPEAVFIRGSFERYREASAEFLDILGEFTPDVEPMGLEEAYADITGFEPLYGPARNTALEMKERVRLRIGLAASVGLAGSRVMAKIASGHCKPDGLLEVQVGEELSFLASLPVGKLPGVGSKTGGVLQRMGVRTIGDLQRLPLTFLKANFGVHGEAMHLHAHGLDMGRWRPPVVRRSISRETTFGEDVTDRAQLIATLRLLGERVGAALRAQVRLAKCVTVKVRYADFETATQACTLRGPVGTDQAILRVGRDLLEKVLGQRPYPVRLVGIGVSSLREGRQLSMFDPQTERMEQLNAAVDSIRSKYGFSAVEVGRTPVRSGAVVGWTDRPPDRGMLTGGHGA